ncbi:hypothetical protein HOK96_03045, partial [bacterium]|nr:hypothetical protein [bacterium]
MESVTRVMKTILMVSFLLPAGLLRAVPNAASNPFGDNDFRKVRLALPDGSDIVPSILVMERACSGIEVPEAVGVLFQCVKHGDNAIDESVIMAALDGCQELLQEYHERIEDDAVLCRVYDDLSEYARALYQGDLEVVRDARYRAASTRGAGAGASSYSDTAAEHGDPGVEIPTSSGGNVIIKDVDSSGNIVGAPGNFNVGGTLTVSTLSPTNITVTDNATVGGTLGVTGIATFTAQSVHTGGLQSGGNVVSDTDSTDNLGTSSVRWANVYTDSIGDSGQTLDVGATTMSFDAASTIDTSGNNALAVNTGTANLNITAGTVAVTGNETVSGTLGVTGVGTFTAQSVHSAGLQSGGNVVSDTDSTDDIGTTSIRWANVYTDSIGDTGQALTVTAGANNVNVTAGTVAVTGNETVSGTLGVTGVGTFTAQSVHSAGLQSGGNVVSDTDSTDNLGTAAVRWANVYTDSIGDSAQTLDVGATTMSFDAASTIDTSGNNALAVNTGTANLNITAGTVAVTGNETVSGTLGVTGVGTFTAQSVHSAGLQSGGNVVSDTDSTDDLGTSSIRWANVYTDSIGDTGQALTVTAGANNVNVTAGTVAVTGNETVSGTLGVTGVGTFTAQSVHSAGIQSGGNVVSDTDSTDDLGTTSVRWANVYTDSLGDTGQALTITAGANNVNVTAGTVAVTGSQTVSGTLGVTGAMTATGGLTSGGNLVSDTDSTDDIGTTSVRWANVYTDSIGDTGQALAVKATTMSFDAASTIDTSGNNALAVNTGTANLNITAGTVAVTGNETVSGTLGVTGVGTFTAQSIHTGGMQSGGNVVSDTDSTDDLGTAAVRWANVYTDSIGDTGQALAVKASTLSFDAASQIDTSGNNALTITSGTANTNMTAATLALTGNQTVSGTFAATGASTFSTSVLPDASGGADLGSTAAEWGDVYVADDKFIYMGSDQDIKMGYDETTNDALEISANVEGAALAIVLKADQGDDAGDEWKLNVADGGVLTLGNDIAAAGTYVTHFTMTPHATITSSSVGIAGGATVGGTLGVTGVGTFTAQSVHSAGLQSGGNIVSDTDSTDDLGTTAVRWANVYTDAIGDSGQTLGVKATTLSFDAASQIDTSGNNALTITSGTANTNMTAGTVAITGNETVSGTLGVTGVGTFTAQSVHSAGLQTGGNIVSDTDSTDSLGTAALRWANIYTDSIGDNGQTLDVGATTLSFDAASQIDTSGNNALTITSGTANTNMTAGTFALTGNETVSGTLAVTGELTATSQVRIPAGTLGEPAIVFTADDDASGTGIYRSGADSLSIVTNGVAAITLGSTQITSPAAVLNAASGSAAAPTYSFTSAPTVGMYLTGGNAVTFSTGGTARTTIDASGNLVPFTAGTYNLGSASAEWGDVYVADDKYIYMGDDQDIKMGYDATTNNSLEISANVEAAAFGLVMKADQGDDAGDAWKVNIADGGVMTIGNDINAQNTFVAQMTLTPNATVASSTTAIAGNATVGGTLAVTGALTPATADGAALGSATLEWSDLYLADGGVVYFGNDQDVTLTHVADTGLLLNSTREIQFRDSALKIWSSADGQLDFSADGEVQIATAAFDVNATGAVTVDSTGAGISLDGAGASNFVTTSGALTLTGAAASTWSTSNGALVVSGDDGLTLTAANTAGVTINSASGTMLLNGAGQTVDTNCATFDLDATGAVTADAGGAISLDGGAASNFTTSAGALTLDGAGGVNIAGNSAEVDITTTGAVD